MSESVIAVVHKSKNAGHRVVCTFDNLQCKKAVDVPVVYKFKECDL